MKTVRESEKVSDTPPPPLIEEGVVRDIRRVVLSDWRQGIRKRLHDAVRLGDIALVEDLLDEPGSDINAIYYGESLLWTAIANEHIDMAKFLIDNGANTEFKNCRVEIKATKHADSAVANKQQEKKTPIRVRLRDPSMRSVSTSAKPLPIPSTPLADVYVISCRELAYEKGLFDLVTFIDYKQGRMLKTLKPLGHTPRLHKSANRRLEESGMLIDLPLTKMAAGEQRSATRTSGRQSAFAAKTPVAGRSSKLASRNTCYTPARHASTARLSPGLSDLGDAPDYSVTLSKYLSQQKPAMRNHSTLVSPPAEYIIYPTRTSMARKNFTTSNTMLDLKHPECSTPLAKPHIAPGMNYAFEKKISALCPSDNYSFKSYRNHLPQRRAIAGLVNRGNDSKSAKRIVKQRVM